jgi:hypothetical protein
MVNLVDHTKKKIYSRQAIFILKMDQDLPWRHIFYERLSCTLQWDKRDRVRVGCVCVCVNCVTLGNSPLQKAPGLLMVCLHTSPGRFFLQLFSVNTWDTAPLPSCNRTQSSIAWHTQWDGLLAFLHPNIPTVSNVIVQKVIGILRTSGNICAQNWHAEESVRSRTMWQIEDVIQSA